MMAYIFNAMTHLAVDIRFMAFDFLDLTLEYYPPSFSSYTEKIFQNYEDILRKNQYHLQDKEKLKDTFAGLVRCLSLLPWNKEETDLQNKDDIGQRVNQDVKIADVPDVVNTSQSTPEHLLEAMVANICHSSNNDINSESSFYRSKQSAISSGKKPEVSIQNVYTVNPKS